MASLLPPNATDLETAVAEAIARLSDVSVPLRNLWRPDTCPEELLPYLAWALSVDIWDEDWPESKRRAVIAAAVQVHRHKGTPGSVKAMLAALDFEAKVSENWEYGGAAYRFKVQTTSRFSGADAIDLFYKGICASKNLRSWLDAIQAPHEDQADINAAGLATLGVSITGLMDTSVTVTDVDLSAVGVAAMPLLVHGLLPSPDVQVQDVGLAVAGVAYMPIILSGYLPEEVV